MLIVAFEGLDKSGKNTQTKKIVEYLQSIGCNVETTSFHRYDTPTGALIRKFLDGEYNVNQFAIEQIMTADKYAQLDWINSLRADTDVLILDRYITSQIVYSYSNGIDVSYSTELLKYMPEPDYQFYLDITAEESMSRKGEHGDNDKYESNLELLTNVRENYLKVMRLEVEQNKGAILDGSLVEDTIHEDIKSDILSLINSKKGE